MRVTIEHREGSPGLLHNERAYYLDCSIDFSEEEKAVIARRGLAAHHITMPAGYPAVLDATEQKRIYGLKLAVAAGFTVFAILLSGLMGGHALPAFMFFGGAGYTVYCLYRFLNPKTLSYERLALGDIIKNRRFILQTSNPTRSKETEEKVLIAIAELKGFLAESTDVAPRSVHEF